MTVFVERQLSPTGYAASVSNIDGSLTISPTTGAVIASVNTDNIFTWTQLHTFLMSASSFFGVKVNGDLNPYTGNNTETTAFTVSRTLGDVTSAGGDLTNVYAIKATVTNNNNMTEVDPDSVTETILIRGGITVNHDDSCNYVDGGTMVAGCYIPTTRAGTITGTRLDEIFYGYYSSIDVAKTYNNAGGTYSDTIYGIYSFVSQGANLTAGSYATTCYGAYINVQGGASGTTTGYGLYINNVTGFDTKWAIYAGAQNSYFGGNVSIQVSTFTPTAYLHLGAGTAAASTAPLKFSSGTLNTAPEVGAVEFLTDRLYVSDSTTRYPILVGSLGFSGGTTLIGGTAATDDLILRSTSGTATSGSDIIFQTGTNGGTEIARMKFDGTFALVGIGQSSPTAFLHVTGVQPASSGSSPGTNSTTVLTVLGGTGGNTTATSSPSGGVGATFSITSGTGGTANSGTSGTATSGAGGAGTISSGTGGNNSLSQASTVSKGGAGGTLNINSGSGGSGSNSLGGGSTGGAGGTISITASNGGTATGNGSGTVTSGAGGAITITAGSGGSASSGGTLVYGAGGNVTINAGTAGSNSASATNGQTGGTISIAAGAGGMCSSGTGGTGGSATYTSGTGGATTSGGVGGNGGAATFSSGGGNSGSNNTGGNGGTVTVQPGTGAANTTTSGNGGTLTIIGGTGGQTSSSGTCGNGGNTSVTGGSGGNVSSSGTNGNAGTLTLAGGTGGGQGSSSANGKDGGACTIKGGTGGSTTTGTSGNGGNLTISGGIAGTNSGGTSGAGGIITFQAAVTTSLATCGNIDKNGRWFIGGSTTATAVLHLAAGTATANTAPLKFTSGTNLTAAEAGTIEFDGSDFFLTV